MRNRTIIERFVNGATKGRGHHVYIEKNVIFSYGPHFPMAIRSPSGETFLINGDKYSSSTSRHQSCLKSAILEVHKSYGTLDTTQLREKVI